MQSTPSAPHPPLAAPGVKLFNRPLRRNAPARHRTRHSRPLKHFGAAPECSGVCELRVRRRVGLDEECKNNFTERGAWPVKKSRRESCSKKNPDRDFPPRFDFDAAGFTDTQDYRMFVATWNVGEESPHGCVNLEDWLHASPPADLYVFGFYLIRMFDGFDIVGRLDEECKNNFTERGAWPVKKIRRESCSKKNPDQDFPPRFDFYAAGFTDTQDYRMFVATWNVGGKSPHGCVNLEDWLHASPPADLYVFGYQ
ncbi:Type I inositol 1,4,5-trisphosphate 5-phosphatase CVP2 [Platanthera guangdongensis]|uniref:Type I inositol 1,4,5-trisphosphate 5-phosphatase CVP2 n=1 Tax=Platanthera guangdongensis TaxID=2320717 RepID=A0ABR2MIN5_9ASPA